MFASCVLFLGVPFALLFRFVFRVFFGGGFSSSCLFSATRKKAHKRNMQYLPRQNVNSQGARSRRRPHKEGNNGRKVTKIPQKIEPNIEVLAFLFLTFSGPQASAAKVGPKDPKKSLKWLQHRPQNHPQRPPDSQNRRSKSMLDFILNFDSDFYYLGGQNGSQNGT